MSFSAQIAPMCYFDNR